jgi:hypothetical protein
MLSLFMMIMLSLIVLEIHEGRPLVAMWIVGLAPVLRWAFLMLRETREVPPPVSDVGTIFAVEGELWNIYSRVEKGERVFWSGRVDWPGGDDWVEVLEPESRSLEAVLPEPWIAFNPLSVAPELVETFRAAYRRKVASLPPADRKEYVEFDKGRDWRKILGIPKNSDSAGSAGTPLGPLCRGR